MDKTLKTIAGYNRCAAEFTTQHFELGVYQKYVREFADLLPPGALILDLGCGPGNIACFLSKQNPGCQITGVDFSSQMLKLARQNIPSARLIHQDLRYLELAEKFDALIISFCIIHLDDHETESLLRKSFNWLNTNGYLYVNFMKGGTAGFAETSFSTDALYFNYYSAKQFDALLTQIGYQIVSRQSRACPQNGRQGITEVFIIAKRP
jgi:ubiquinone/menaquinone biosynthesis C-methylase UbiE